MRKKTILLAIILVCELHAQSPFDIWDTDYLTDSRNLNVDTLWATDTILSGLTFRLAEIRYNSVGDPGEIIRIQAFIAAPEGENLPAILVGHGNEESGSIMLALSIALTFRAITLSISGPGCGESEGQNSDPLNWARTYPDPRTSWIYQYTCAAIRGITYLRTIREVDTTFICILGYSAGGIAALLANGVDNRIRLAMPIMASGDWLTSIRDSSWLYYAVCTSISEDDPRITNLLTYLDPIRYSSSQHGLVFLSIGAQDEFFPINSVANFINSLNPLRTRSLVVGNWDHATYYGSDPRYSGQYDAFDNSLSALRKIIQANLAVYNATRIAGIVPPAPFVRAIQLGNTISFTATTFPGLQDSLFIWISTDSAWTFQSFKMNQINTSTFTYNLNLLPGQSLENIIYFVESFGTGFILSSVPHIPSGIRVRVRPPRGFTQINEKEEPYKVANIAVFPSPSVGNVNFKLNTKISKLEIYNINGELVRKLYNTTSWDGYDQNMRMVSPGIYFIKAITENDIILTSKIILIR